MSSTVVVGSATVGTVVPEVVFKARVRDASIEGTNPFTWKDVTTTDLFKGKRVVLFALPGGNYIVDDIFFANNF